MKIRTYTDKDYPAVLALYAASKLDELRYENVRFELLPLDRDTKRLGQLLESEIYICEDVGIVGYCAKYGLEIRALFVHPDSRGKGIGRYMLEFMLAKIQGPARCTSPRPTARLRSCMCSMGSWLLMNLKLPTTAYRF